MIFIKRLTRRFIINAIDGLELSTPISYERYYINDTLRIQKKGQKLEKEILDSDNVVIKKEFIEIKELEQLKKQSYKKIIRDSYLYLKDKRVSIKKYYDEYESFIRVEVSFDTKEEMENYQKENWMGKEITDSPLAFDKYLSKLTKEQFLLEMKKYQSS